jgi:hypothetical protein
MSKQGKIILTFSTDKEGIQTLQTQPEGIKAEDREEIAKRFLEYCQMTVDHPIQAFISTGMNRSRIEELGFNTASRITSEDEGEVFIQKWAVR